MESVPAAKVDRVVPLVIACTFFMQMLDTSILNTSLPQMARAFGVKPLDMSLGVTVYMLVFAAMLPLSGWLSDRFGARTIYVLAVGVFTASSLACGLSSSLPTFVAARAVQGLGASMMTPVGRVIVVRTTSRSGLLQAMATISWPALAAPLIGPLLGGFLTTWASWRWNFFVNIPIGIVGASLIRAFVPAIPARPGRKFDMTGFVLSSSSMASLLFGIESAAHGDGSWNSLASLAWGVLGGAWAVIHLRRVEAPLLDLAPLGIPSFRLATLSAGMWVRVAISSTPFLLPLLFQIGLGCSPIVSGAFLTSYFAGNLAMKGLAPAALRAYGFRPVVVLNASFVGISLLSMLFIGGRLPTFVIVAFLFLCGLVRSLQFTSMATLVFADVPVDLSAPASTISSMAQQISMAFGVAFTTGCLTLSRAVSERSELVLRDFRVAIVGAALLAFLASWIFRGLSPSVGAEITGRSSAVP